MNIFFRRYWKLSSQVGMGRCSTNFGDGHFLVISENCWSFSYINFIVFLDPKWLLRRLLGVFGHAFGVTKAHYFTSGVNLLGSWLGHICVEELAKHYVAKVSTSTNWSKVANNCNPYGECPTFWGFYLWAFFCLIFPRCWLCCQRCLAVVCVYFVVLFSDSFEAKRRNF